MTVKFHITGEELEAVVDIAASASVVGKSLAPKLGIRKRVRKIKVRQGDGSFLKANFVVNTLLKVMNSSSLLGKFAINAEVLDIENSDVILGLSWLTVNAFLVNTQDRCLRNVNSGQVIPCSVRWISKVAIMEEE